MTFATLLSLSTLAVAAVSGEEPHHRASPPPCEPGVAYLTADFSALLEPVVRSIAGEDVLPAGLALEGVGIEAREARFTLGQESGVACVISLGPPERDDAARRGRWFSIRGDGDDLCLQALGPILARVDGAFQADPWTPCTRGVDPPGPASTRVYRTQPRPLVLAVAVFHLLVLLVALVASVSTRKAKSDRTA
jgi:hypothetical protein